MVRSCRHFMEQLIDFAGMFPPASLPLETAIRQYAVYLHGEDAWMLGRFVMPAQHLDAIEPYMPLFSEERPLSLAVLASRSEQPEQCLQLLDESLEQIQSARAKFGSSIRIDVLELPLPSVPIDRPLLDVISNQTSSCGLSTFCEMTFPLLGSDWLASMEAALDSLAASDLGNGRRLGVKLRTGGVRADRFPEPSQVAAVLTMCRDRGLPLKFTAGLHHPVRMYRKEVQCAMHGFLNVFIAGILSHIHKLDAQTTERILSDEHPGHFFFTEEAMGWKELTVTAEDVQKLRRRAFISYGSCSFDEPTDELRELPIFK